MDEALRCECGFEASGSESHVVAAAQAHAWDAHGMELSSELARALCRPKAILIPPKEPPSDALP
jgi:hypothetical protein